MKFVIKILEGIHIGSDLDISPYIRTPPMYTNNNHRIHNFVALSYFVTMMILIDFWGKSPKIYIGKQILKNLVPGVYKKLLGIKESDTHTQLNGCNVFQDEIFSITQV